MKARATRLKRSHERSGDSVVRTSGGQAATASADDTSKIDATIRERAREIIAKLETVSPRNEATTLEAWMAHYIAELLYRAEDRQAEADTRAAAACECSEVVRDLWRLELARDQARVGHSIYQDRWRDVPTVPSSIVDALRRPSSVRSWSTWDRLLGVFTLAQVDEELIRALYLASVRLKPPAAAGSQEQGQDHARPEDVQAGLDRAIAALATVFPEIPKTKLSDIRRLNTVIGSALERTLNLRAQLLGALPESDNVDTLRRAVQRDREAGTHRRKSATRQGRRRRR
ncbi:MAG: hypothetical protein ACREM3_03685 [Candidatus Rokuibacteriota bacterium]